MYLFISNDFYKNFFFHNNILSLKRFILRKINIYTAFMLLIYNFVNNLFSKNLKIFIYRRQTC